MSEFTIKDSGARQEFEGGAMRDTEEGKIDYSNLFVWFEPMGTRYAEHMTKGRAKYDDVMQDGVMVPNWTLFEATPETLARTERSLDRHFKDYRAGKRDEDHAAAIMFNLNLAEKIREALSLGKAWAKAMAREMYQDPTFENPKPDPGPGPTAGRELVLKESIVRDEITLKPIDQKSPLPLIVTAVGGWNKEYPGFFPITSGWLIFAGDVLGVLNAEAYEEALQGFCGDEGCVCEPDPRDYIIKEATWE